jgi:hypothetical protein
VRPRPEPESESSSPPATSSVPLTTIAGAEKLPQAVTPIPESIVIVPVVAVFSEPISITDVPSADSEIAPPEPLSSPMSTRLLSDAPIDPPSVVSVPSTVKLPVPLTVRLLPSDALPVTSRVPSVRETVPDGSNAAVAAVRESPAFRFSSAPPSTVSDEVPNAPASVWLPSIVNGASCAGTDGVELVTPNVPVPSVRDVAPESDSEVVAMSPLSVTTPIKSNVERVAVEDVERSSSPFSSVKVEPNVAAPCTPVVPPSSVAPSANVAVPVSVTEPSSCSTPVRPKVPVSKVPVRSTDPPVLAVNVSEALCRSPVPPILTVSDPASIVTLSLGPGGDVAGAPATVQLFGSFQSVGSEESVPTQV